MSGRRGLRLALLLCLLGGGLVLWAASATWASYRPLSTAAFAEPEVSSTGGELYPAVTAMAWVGLAGVLALVAARSWTRRLVGLVVGLGGVVVGVQAGAALAETPVPLAARCGQGVGCLVLRERLHAGTGWMALALVGGVLLVLAGLLAVVRGGSWGGLGSSYEAPGAAPEPPVTDKAVWDALDRGDDPTA